MKALTIWQPHATLLATGARRIETRGWPTAYRGPLVIHAACRWNAGVARECDWAMRCLNDLAATWEPLSGPAVAFAAIEWRNTLGRVLAVADLVDCRRIPRPKGTPLDRLLGGFGRGRWGWVLENPRLVEPAYRRGSQGLWECDVSGLRPFTCPGHEAPAILFPDSEEAPT